MSQQGNIQDGGGSSSDVSTLTGNIGGPVPPSAGGNINILGTAPLTVTGNPGTNTLTISGAGSIPLTFTEDSGLATPAANNLNVFGTAAQGIVTSGATDTVTITASDATELQKGVMALATDAEAIAGTVSNKAIVPTSLKAKLGTQTLNGAAYGTGTTTAIGWTAAGTDGQLLIAATGAAPAFASLTSTGGTITVTGGANTLNVETAGSVATSYVEDTGSAIPALGILNINGTAAQGISTSGATNVVTITAADATTTQKGVSELATDAEAIDGTDSTKTIVPTSLKAKLGVQTNKGIAYGTGTTTAIGWTSGLTNGQLAIGSTAGVPAAANLTAGSGISITNGSNSITIAATGANSQIVIQTFTSNGTYTPTTGMDYCIIEVLGGGGGGGGAAATSAIQFSSGAGGGGGEYERGAFSAATIGASQAVTIGAAGAANSGAAGGNGGTSSVGAIISAGGGIGGGTIAAAAGGLLNGSAGGSGGSGGSLVIGGNTGGYAWFSTASGFLVGGNGANTIYGAGGGAQTTPNTAGFSASSFGSGGGGASNGLSQAAIAGGSGGAGIVIITEFI